MQAQLNGPVFKSLKSKRCWLKWGGKWLSQDVIFYFGMKFQLFFLGQARSKFLLLLQAGQHCYYVVLDLHEKIQPCRFLGFDLTNFVFNREDLINVVIVFWRKN